MRAAINCEQCSHTDGLLQSLWCYNFLKYQLSMPVNMEREMTSLCFHFSMKEQHPHKPPFTQTECLLLYAQLCYNLTGNAYGRPLMEERANCCSILRLPEAHLPAAVVVAPEASRQEAALHAAAGAKSVSRLQ